MTPAVPVLSSNPWRRCGKSRGAGPEPGGRSLTCTVGLQSVPDVAVKVVVAGQQQASALGERHGGDAADDVVVGVDHQLLVGAQVEQPAGGVV